MARWNARERQRLVDEYLNESGANYFVPQEFLSWLGDRPDHPVYDLFFGQSEADLASAMREQMVRRWISGLRVTVTEASQTTSEVKGVVVREMPAYVSPVSGRKMGGGYLTMNASDPDHRAELMRQGASALDAWVRRYGGAAEMEGVDLTPIREIATVLAGGVVQRAA